MGDIQGLIERLEKAEGPSIKLDAEIVCATMAPDGAYVEQSPLNGAWCIYYGVDTRSGRARLWDRRGVNYRPEGWAVTSSLDAALALVERVLPGWQWSAGDDAPVTQFNPMRHPCWARVFPRDRGQGHGSGNQYAATAPLALCLAALKSLAQDQRKGDGDGE